MTTGVSLSYRYVCFIDGALRHWEWGVGAVGGAVGGADLSPTPPCTETMKRGGKGSEEKISWLLAVGVINCSFLLLTCRPICV